MSTELNLRVVVDLHDVAHVHPAGVTALLVATNPANQLWWDVHGQRAQRGAAGTVPPRTGHPG